MRWYVLREGELAAKEAVGVVYDLLTNLYLRLLAHWIEAVLRLLCLQQNSLTLRSSSLTDLRLNALPCHHLAARIESTSLADVRCAEVLTEIVTLAEQLHRRGWA